MAEGVAVVEELPAAGVVEVLADRVGLDLHGAGDQLGGGRPAGGVGLEQVEDRAVGDEAALDDLGQPGAELGLGQAVEDVGVGEDGDRRVERADQVLAGVGVDAGLAAHRGVDHAEQAGGHLHHADPAQPGGGDEAGQVGHRSPADADHDVGAGVAQPAQLGPQARGDLDGLGRLAVRHDQRLGGQPRALQGGDHLAGEPGQRRRVHHGGAGGAGQHGAGQQGELVPGARADDDVVGASPATVTRCSSLTGAAEGGQGGEHVGDHRGGGAATGLQVQRGDLAVEGGAGLQHLPQHLPRVHPEDRPVAGEADALGRGRQVDVQPDDGAAGAAVRDEQCAGVRAGDRAAAEGQHAVVLGQRTGDGALLHGPEVRLAVGDEQVGDRGAGLGLDVVVGVAEGGAQLAGQPGADGGLARGGRPDQHDRRPDGSLTARPARRGTR